MRLKEFNSENTMVARSGSPCIGVNQKTGVFNMNKLATELMGLKNGDGITIHQDEDQPENWYIEKAKTNGFITREKKDASGGLMFNNTTLARAIAEGGGCSGSFRLLIAGQPTKHEKRVLWGLLFRSNS